jgi:eukaryotic-like serine/threonine-protein kinase
MSDESIFAAALSRAPGVERRAFLDGACGSDDALRRRIERLLEADGQTAGILERGPDAGPTEAPGEDGPPLLPERVFAGRFKLRQKLGEGGMGEVWVADQAAHVQRRVAIKVVRPGLDYKRRLARFDQERASTVRKSIPRLISSSATCRRTCRICPAKKTVPMPPLPIAWRILKRLPMIVSIAP